MAGLTVLGGEPMEAENQEALYPFLKRIRQEFPDKSIWIYTGYLWEELTAEGRAQLETHPAKGNPQKIFLEHRRYCRCRWTLPLLRLIDILVDGEFHEAEKDLSIRFRGSRNQRLIDVKESLARGEVVLSEFMYKEGE